MNRTTLLHISFVGFAALMFSISVLGQNRPASPPGTPQDAAGTALKRPNLLQELGLSVDQMQQIRRINESRKPLMDQAVHRLQEANKNLDLAIYADILDENDVHLRLREYHEAQAEVARLRFMSELQIRRVLTPDQLVRFRDLRAKFAALMEAERQRRQQNGRRPPLNPQPGQFRPN